MENGKQSLLFLIELVVFEQQHAIEFYTVALQHIHYYSYEYSVIGGWNNNKIYRLSDDEQEWIEVGEFREKRWHFGVASLNGKIYITGGQKSLILYDK